MVRTLYLVMERRAAGAQLQLKGQLASLHIEIEGVEEQIRSIGDSR